MSDFKYGAESRAFLAATGAESVITIVIGGVHGHGLATVARAGILDPHSIADMLRRLATQFDHAAASGDPVDIRITPRSPS